MGVGPLEEIKTMSQPSVKLCKTACKQVDVKMHVNKNLSPHLNLTEPLPTRLPKSLVFDLRQCILLRAFCQVMLKDSMVASQQC